MKKLICALIGVAALVASATTYIQTSSTGTAPWKPVKDSVSQARLADSARQADTARAAWKADSARVAWFAHAATYADSSRVSGLADSAKRAGISDTAKKAGTAANSLALGGVASDYFVQGSNASRTQVLTGAATSQAMLFKSGFYDSQHWTDFSSRWTHMIHCAYSNNTGTTNDWSFDIAADFAESDGSSEHYYVRTVAGSSSLGWRELIHSANYPSFNNFTSGLSTTTLTASGLITANGGVNAKAVNFPGGLSVTSGSATLTANSPRLIKVNYNGLTIINLPAPTDGLEFEVLSSGEYSVACVNIAAPSSVVFTQGSGTTSGPSANTSNVCANYARHFQIASDGSYWFVKY